MKPETLEKLYKGFRYNLPDNEGGTIASAILVLAYVLSQKEEIISDN